MTPTAKPFDAYLRVSKTRRRTEEDPTFLGPSQQREAIERHATDKGLSLTWNDPELDSTGSKLSRPILDGILERIQSKQSAGIIVASVNRLSRAGTGEAIKLVEDVLKAGGKVVVADLGVDPETIEGELIITVWLGMARADWRRIQDKWLKARRSATERGAPVGPAARGYDKGEHGLLVPNDDLHRVAQAFHAATIDGVAGAKWVCEEHWPDVTWSTTNVRKLLEKRVYKGTAYSGEFVTEDVVPAAVTSETWALAQPGAPRGRRSNGEYPLSKIAHCGTCGGELTGHQAGRTGKTQRGLRCRNDDCSARVHVYAGELEEIVLDRIRAAGDRWGREVSIEEGLALNQTLIDAQAELDGFLTAPRPEDMDDAEWEARRKGLKAAVQVARSAQDASLAAARGLPDLDDDTPSVRRHAFELTIKSLTVDHGRGTPLTPRVHLELSA